MTRPLEPLVVARLDTGGIGHSGMEYLAIAKSEAEGRRLIAERYLAFHVERMANDRESKSDTETNALDWIAWEIADGEARRVATPDKLGDALAEWYGISTTEVGLGEAVIV